MAGQIYNDKHDDKHTSQVHIQTYNLTPPWMAIIKSGQNFCCSCFAKIAIWW